MSRRTLLSRFSAFLIVVGLLASVQHAASADPSPLAPVVETPPLPIDGLPLIDLPELPLPFDPDLLIGGLLGDPTTVLGGLSGALDGVIGRFPGDALGPVGITGGVLMPTPGTETFSGTVVWDGITRSYAGIRPIGAPAGAPVLLLLHPRMQSPARTANLTRIGRLAAEYGVWIYLPAAVAAVWADSPITGLVDDVGFLNALLTREAAAHALDASRIYAAGYSNGGFMAERLACERPERLAGIAIAAANLRESLASRCTGPRRIPVLMFNGTLDPLTPYAGAPGMRSAPATAAFWAERNQCAAGEISRTTLPDRDTRDNTTVTVTRYNRCVDSTVALYTVNNGGHTWPGTPYAGYTLALGETSGDVDATLELWQQLLPYSKPAAP